MIIEMGSARSSKFGEGRSMNSIGGEAHECAARSSLCGGPSIAAALFDHGIAVDPKTRQVFVNDRGNRRAQVFDENGKFLREWSFGAAPADIHLFHIFSDGYLWAADRGTNRMLKYDLEGNFMYSWGTWGDFPGGMWGVHGFSVDQDGNVYVAEVDNGGAQKYSPRKGANPAMMIGKPLRVAWK